MSFTLSLKAKVKVINVNMKSSIMNVVFEAISHNFLKIKFVKKIYLGLGFSDYSLGVAFRN